MIAQSGESKYKSVVLKKTEKKVVDIKPSFSLSNVLFSDVNNNEAIDGKEECNIKLSVKNTGNILLENLNVQLSESNRLSGIFFTTNQKVSQLNIGDSIMVTIPVKADETLKDSIANFTITVSDSKNNIMQQSQLLIPTKGFVFVQKIDSVYHNEKRLALVIGNADYIQGNILSNPVNDAKAIASALREVGFTVLLYLDADLKTMKKAMDNFGERLGKYNVGLFYYAGHGIQIKGNNYLIPTDANPSVEQDIDYDCIEAGRLLGKMEAAGTSTNIVILDACRDNPFERSWSSRSSGKGSGLAFMNAPSGTIIAYATSPGKTASDGSGKYGLYTEAILKYIKVPGLMIEEFFKNVRIMVETKSRKTQTPWESTSLKGNFFFRAR